MTYFFERNFDEERMRTGIAIGQNGDAVQADDTLLRDADERARQQGFDDGYRQGLLDGRAELEVERAAEKDKALGQLAKCCETLCGDAENHRQVLEQEMLEFATRACEKVLPDLIQAQSSDRVFAEIRRHLRLAMGSPKLTVKISEATYQKHGAKLEAALKTSASTTEIELSVDDQLAEGDARMAWQNGMMEYNYERVCASVLDALRSVRKAASKPKNERMPEDV